MQRRQGLFVVFKFVRRFLPFTSIRFLVYISYFGPQLSCKSHEKTIPHLTLCSPWQFTC